MVVNNRSNDAIILMHRSSVEMIMILVVQKPEHSLMKNLINLKVLLGDAREVPSCRQAQLKQVQQQLGLVSHLWVPVESVRETIYNL